MHLDYLCLSQFQILGACLEERFWNKREGRITFELTELFNVCKVSRCI